jgi:hypothetical protein
MISFTLISETASALLITRRLQKYYEQLWRFIRNICGVSSGIFVVLHPEGVINPGNILER